MFNVEIGETKIVLIAEQSGKKNKLIHHLRQPNAKENMDYLLDRAGEMEIDRAREVSTMKPGLSTAKARINLYNKIAVKVEGYCDAEGKEIQCAKDGWKDLIPPEHKIAAIGRWDPSERVACEDEDEKN